MADMTKTRTIHDVLRVGRVADEVFVGCPSSIYYRSRSVLTDDVMHSMRLRRDDVAWLIGALRKELYGQPDDEVETWMDDGIGDLRANYDLLDRKVRHGCTDASCEECDNG